MTDELDILDDSDLNVKEYNGKRPPFLTVLCILTFVGAGLLLLYSFIMWVSITAVGNMVESFDGGNSEEMEVFRWIKLFLFASLIANLLCIAGAIVMMLMRKIGFYIYVVGQVIPVIVLLMALGTNVQEEFGMVMIVIMTVFPAGFIVMYGLNFKYLR